MAPRVVAEASCRCCAGSRTYTIICVYISMRPCTYRPCRGAWQPVEDMGSVRACCSITGDCAFLLCGLLLDTWGLCLYVVWLWRWNEACNQRIRSHKQAQTVTFVHQAMAHCLDVLLPMHSRHGCLCGLILAYRHRMQHVTTPSCAILLNHTVAWVV